jgi:NADH-quinone oxidoreductase subunit C
MDPMPLETLKAKLAALAVRAAAPAPAPAAGESAPAEGPPAPLVAETNRAARGTDLDVTVPPARVVDAARILDEAQFALEAITGVDWLAEQEMEIVYDYASYAAGTRVVVRARVPRAAPELPTICGLHPGANWHERETHDFFGVVFTGHPELLPLLLPEDATFHPLRKDYSP